MSIPTVVAMVAGGLFGLLVGLVALRKGWLAGPRRAGEDDPVERLSPEHVRQLGEQVARDLVGVPLDRALEMLDRGELAGKLAEPELRMIRGLLDRQPAPSVRASRHAA